MWERRSIAFKGDGRDINLKLTPIAIVLQQRERGREGVRMPPNILLLLLSTLLNPAPSSPASTFSSSLLLLLPALPSISPQSKFERGDIDIDMPSASPLSCPKCDPTNESCEAAKMEFIITQRSAEKATQEYKADGRKRNPMLIKTECRKVFLAAIRESKRLSKKKKEMMMELKNKGYSINAAREYLAAKRNLRQIFKTECGEEYVAARRESNRLLRKYRRSMTLYNLMKNVVAEECLGWNQNQEN